MFNTRVAEILGIKYPILAGPMAYLSTPELVSAVSNAGGLGILPSMAYRTTDEFRDALRKTLSMTDKPFAVNVTLLPIARPVNYEDYFKTALSEGVRIIETSGRSPEAFYPMLSEARVIKMHRASSTKNLQTAERAGADILTVLGNESGGHPGQEEVGSMVRIPVAVKSVKVPVIAAGGICDGSGFVAAMALGAQGILMGTRFMASKECPMHDNIKQWLLQLKESDTILIQKSLKNTLRVVRTAHTEKILEMENRGASLEELLPLISGSRGAHIYANGNYNDASITVGQVIGLIDSILTVQEIIDGIIKETYEIKKRLNRWVE